MDTSTGGATPPSPRSPRSPRSHGSQRFSPRTEADSEARERSFEKWQDAGRRKSKSPAKVNSPSGPSASPSRCCSSQKSKDSSPRAQSRVPQAQAVVVCEVVNREEPETEHVHPQITADCTRFLGTPRFASPDGELKPPVQFVASDTGQPVIYFHSAERQIPTNDSQSATLHTIVEDSEPAPELEERWTLHPQLLLGLHDVTSLNKVKARDDDWMQGLSQCKDADAEHLRLCLVRFTERFHEQLCLERDEREAVIQELRSEFAETRAISSEIAEQMACSSHRASSSCGHFEDAANVMATVAATLEEELTHVQTCCKRARDRAMEDVNAFRAELGELLSTQRCEVRAARSSSEVREDWQDVHEQVVVLQREVDCLREPAANSRLRTVSEEAAFEVERLRSQVKDCCEQCQANVVLCEEKVTTVQSHLSSLCLEVMRSDLMVDVRKKVHTDQCSLVADDHVDRESVQDVPGFSPLLSRPESRCSLDTPNKQDREDAFRTQPTLFSMFTGLVSCQVDTVDEQVVSAQTELDEMPQELEAPPEDNGETLLQDWQQRSRSPEGLGIVWSSLPEVPEQSGILARLTSMVQSASFKETRAPGADVPRPEVDDLRNENWVF